jgi:hypothetical protein
MDQLRLQFLDIVQPRRPDAFAQAQHAAQHLGHALQRQQHAGSRDQHLQRPDRYADRAVDADLLDRHGLLAIAPAGDHQRQHTGKKNST